MPLDTLRRLLYGEAILLGLAGAVVAIVTARRGAAWLGLEGLRAGAGLLLVLLPATMVALAPAARRAWRRVRSPAFAASLARYSYLPRWYVAPAALAGGIADEAARLAHAWAVAEAYSGSGWRAAGAVTAIVVGSSSLPGPATSVFPAITGAALLAAVLAWDRALYSVAA